MEITNKCSNVISPRFRKAIFVLIILISVIYVFLTWIGKFSFFALSEFSESHIDTILGTAIQTTGSICGVILALVFITAQLALNKPYVMRMLYRSIEVYILVFYFVVTLFLGYVVFPLTSIAKDTYWVLSIINTVIIFSIASVCLVIPVLTLQLENMIPIILASKLSRRMNSRAIMDYGLTSVSLISRMPLVLNYELVTVGLNPRIEDPFRPIHEVLMEAVSARDRVLFGKLFLHFLRPIALVHQVPWKPNLIEKAGKKRWNGIKWRRKKYSPEEKIHTSLAILHYAVKRARNLKKEWSSRDTGRHGILRGIGNLILSLFESKDTEITIRIAIYAMFHISKEYSEIQPFGRIEPINMFFDISSKLDNVSKYQEALLCLEALAWISVRTKQISGNRSLAVEQVLNDKLYNLFALAMSKAMADVKWMPGLGEEDPWRNWLSS